MSKPANTSQPTRSPRWMRILLGLSLAANLAVIGLAAGAALRLFGPGGPPVHVGSLSGAIFRALPPEDRRTLGRAAREAVPRRQSRHEDAKRLAALLRADPFDRTALQALTEEQATARADWQSALRTAWLDMVAEMSSEDRQAYADRIEASATHGKGRKRKGERGDGS